MMDEVVARRKARAVLNLGISGSVPQKTKRAFQNMVTELMDGLDGVEVSPRSLGSPFCTWNVHDATRFTFTGLWRR